MAVSDKKVYVPHLKIVVEPREYRGKKLPMQGPYYFDLTAKSIPQGNYLKKYSWRELREEISILPGKRSIAEAFDYSIKDAKQNLKRKFYSSDLTDFTSGVI